MMEILGNQVMRVDGSPRDYQAIRSQFGGKAGMARIIGALAIIVAVSGSAFGTFIVQPMKLMVPVTPGRRVPLQVTIENTSTQRASNVSLRITDIAQDANAIWQIIEPDSTFDKSKLRSCQSWLHLADNSVEVRPLARVPLRLYAEVPGGTRGYYCAALIAQALVQAGEIEGVTTAMILEFIVPIIINVQGRPMPQDIKLTDVGLEFRPQTMDSTAASVVTLSAKNNGGTYSLLTAYCRVWGKFGGHWRKISDVEYPSDISMIPGAEFTLRKDIGRPLPAGEYKVEGYLAVDGARADQLGRELEFKGDSRIRADAEVKSGLALDLDTRQAIITVAPGQTRSETVQVVNASDDTVTVDVTVGLPEEMEGKVWEDIRGEQFACTDWLQVSPPQFTLQAGQRSNLRLLCKMPASTTQANYYAKIRLTAKYPDGQDAGSMDAYVCVTNKSGQQLVRVFGFPVNLAESSPGRYVVTSRFGNFGDTHVQPMCQGILTAWGTNEVYRRLVMDSAGQSGAMLPLETRSFNGILDVASVPQGRYRLTAVLVHDRGEAVQSQTVLEVMDTDEGKAVKQLDVSAVGGAVKIDLK